MTPWLLLVLAARAEWEPPGDVAEDFNAGVLALQDGRPADAEGAFRAALDADPECGRCAHGLGLSLVRQERLGAAIQVLSTSAERHPRRAELRVALAGATFARQDFQAALGHARAAVGLDATSVDAHVALQQVLLRMGRTDEARVSLAAATLPGPERQCLEILVGLEEGARPGTTQRAYCSQAGHPGLASTVDARIGAFQDRPGATAAAADGATSVELVARALALHQAGSDDRALPLLDRALASEPRRVDARILRAVARARSGDLDGALADLRLVLEAESWVQVHRTGEMSGVLTRTDEAQLRTGIRRGSGLLVSLLVEAGRLEEAEATLQRATRELELGPRLASGAVRLRVAQARTDDAWEVLATSLARWPEDGDLTLLAAELGARDPEGVPPSLAERMATADDWRSAYYQAQAAAKAGDHAACLAEGERSRLGMATLVPPPTADDRVTVLRLVHTCAVNAGNITAADRAAEAMGQLGALGPLARINHALMREDAGDHEGALALLTGLAAPSDAARGLAASVTVYAAGELERWEQALDAAPQADADVALWLALRLAEAERPVDARSAVAGRCEELPGTAAEACQSL